jgi:heat shock protein HslJ
VRYRPLLALLHTGSLSPWQVAGVNEHLASCPSCQQELAAYDALDAAARQHLAGAAFIPLTLEDIMRATAPAPDPTVASSPRTSSKSGPALRHPRHPRHRPPLAALGPLAALVVLVLLAGLLFASHRPGSDVPASGTPIVVPPTANLAHTSWTLTRLVVDGREQPLVPGRAPTLHFGLFNGQSQIVGNGGCNGYSGPYTLSGDTIHINGLGQTQVYCLPQALMDQESAYLQALQQVEHYRSQGNSLTLTSADGSVELIFRAN